jgi:twinkle protein
MNKVEHTEINGYAIEEFNRYGLEVGKTQGICPLCSADRKPENKKSKCASYDWERGLGTCHNCDTTFQLHTFQRRGEVAKVYTRPRPITDLSLGSRVEQWFASRKISRRTLDDLRIAEGFEYMPQIEKKVNAIHFNYYIGNELINIKYRDGSKNFKLYKGAEKIFYNVDSLVGHDTAIIVEGEMDVCALHESGMNNAVSVPNGATLTNNNLDYLDNCIEYFEDKDIVILALDQDEPGQALQTELIRRLGAEVCWIADFDDCKDANEYLIKYGREELAARINKCKPVPMEHVVTFKDIDEELRDFVLNGFKPGYQIGIESFDNIFSTYTSQFITVTGIPSSGKSDFVDMMCVGYNKNYDWKIAYASPENHPTFLHAHKLMRKLWGDMPTSKDFDNEKWVEVSERLNDDFYFIDMDNYTLEAVLAKGAELVRRRGIKCLVIDPFNKVRSEERQSDINFYTMDYLSKIEVFAKKYDVLVIVVAHPTKMYKTPDGKIDEPTMYNIKGGGEWYDASYHGILVHRDYEEKTVKAKVLKVKFQNLGENGAEAHFTWDRRSGRFDPIKVIDMEMPWDLDA